MSLILETLRGHSGISENRKTSNARVFGKKKKRVTEQNDKTTINEKPQTSTLRSLNKLKFAAHELYPISGTNPYGKTENNRIWRPEKTHLKFSLDKCRTETSNIEISSWQRKQPTTSGDRDYTDRKPQITNQITVKFVGKTEMALYNRKTENNRLSREAKLLQCCDLS